MQRGRFAASAGTQQNAKFTIFDIKVKAGYRFDLSKAFAYILQDDFRQLFPSLIAILRLASGYWRLVTGCLSLGQPVARSQQPVARLRLL
jgi:hypothetical protein